MTRKILRCAVNNSINGVFDVTYSVVCDTYLNDETMNMSCHISYISSICDLNVCKANVCN